MGLKENFAQAVRELTGGNKEDNMPSVEKRGVRVENLRRAVDDDQYEPRPKTKTREKTEFDNANIKPGIGSFSKMDEGGSEKIPPLSPSAKLDVTTGEKTAREKKYGTEQGNDRYGQPSTGTYTFASDPPPSSYESDTYTRSQSSHGDEPAAESAVRHSTVDSQNANANSQSATHPAQGLNSNYSNPPVPAEYSTESNKRSSESTSSIYNNLRSELADEITIISKNTVIDGNIRSFANMSIDGDVKGDVETTKDVDVNGKIVGNLTCNNAEMHTSQIQGNIRMKGHIDMERDTLLIGDIMSTFARINGKVKGNLDVAGKAELKSDAVVFGDISASTITIDDGAIIQGFVSTTFLNKEESRNIFPDVITINE